MKKEEEKNNTVFGVGVMLIIGALILLFFVFFPTLKNETSYLFSAKLQDVEIVLEESEAREDQIVPIDTDFSIIVPKIGINSKVIANVDPMNEAEYRVRLKEGVAHAKGSGLPNDDRTTFIFAHSSDSFLENNQLNSIFYLLRKLEKGDKFHIVHKGEIHEYEVSGAGSVGSDAVNFLEDSDGRDVILMTCWPPGTDFKRLLVFGKEI